jgi:hypothetical protein
MEGGYLLDGGGRNLKNLEKIEIFGAITVKNGLFFNSNSRIHIQTVEFEFK